jgi:Bacterial extracellular solute-binding protein
VPFSASKFDFQFTYEHNARAAAAADPDYQYVDLPSEINLSHPAKDAYYRQHAIVVLPGRGTSRSARTIAVPGARVAWGITLLKEAPNKQNAIKFLQLLLSSEGTSALKKNGPDPLFPAIVSSYLSSALTSALTLATKFSNGRPFTVEVCCLTRKRSSFATAMACPVSTSQVLTNVKRSALDW